MKCQCRTFTLLDDYANTVRDTYTVHTIEACLHDHSEMPQDLLFDYTCSCGQFFPANFAMTLTLTAEAWQRVRAMIVCDVMLSPYDDTSKRLDSVVDDIDQLINFDESDLI